MRTDINPILITKTSQLNYLVTKLEQQPILAVDTESNSLFAYRERVCMIQFSIPGFDYLVDPLALADLSALKRIFSDPRIEKVFHAAEYDLLCMKRDFGFEFVSLFDTMLAARIAGRTRVGLGSLIAEEFDVKLEKRYQRANWGKRPLPAAMASYASLDTHYLIALRNKLKEELINIGRWEIAEEDFMRLCLLDGEVPTPQVVDIWRMNGVFDLTPVQVAILQELANYRQKKAEQYDRPLFKVIGDKTLVAIAAVAPKTQEELGGIKGMTSKQLRRHAAPLLTAVQRGLNAEPITRPRNAREKGKYLETLDALREWRKNTARNFGVESDVIMPRELLERVAREEPSTKDELHEILSSVPWRFDRFSRQILEVLAKKY
jgi:ribonuclease D